MLVHGSNIIAGSVLGVAICFCFVTIYVTGTDCYRLDWECYRRISIIVEKTDTGFSAFCNDYPIFTTARTITDLMNNVLEATNLYFEEEQIEIKREDIKFENAT